MRTNKSFLKYFTVILWLTLPCTTSGASPLQDADQNVSLLVTHQFGETLGEADLLLGDGPVSLSVLDILKQKTVVETGFGGRYVSAISV